MLTKKLFQIIIMVGYWLVIVPFIVKYCYDDVFNNGGGFLNVVYQYLALFFVLVVVYAIIHKIFDNYYMKQVIKRKVRKVTIHKQLERLEKGEITLEEAQRISTFTRPKPLKRKPGLPASPGAARRAAAGGSKRSANGSQRSGTGSRRNEKSKKSIEMKEIHVNKSMEYDTGDSDITVEDHVDGFRRSRRNTRRNLARPPPPLVLPILADANCSLPPCPPSYQETVEQSCATTAVPTVVVTQHEVTIENREEIERI